MMLSDAMNTFFNGAIFALLAVVFWLLPGESLLGKAVRLSKLERSFLALMLGFSLFVLLTFAARLMHLPFFLAYLPSLYLTIHGLRRGPRFARKFVGRPTRAQLVFIAIALAGLLLQILPLFRSGRRTEAGLVFSEFSLHDSIWHIYLIDELKEHFPPRHAGFAGVFVKNYHFLLDLTIASLAKYIPLSTFEMYYRVIPAFVSMTASLGVFVLARKLFRSERQALVALVIVLFAGNASWFVQFLRGSEFRYSSITFMLDPLVDMLLNPHAVMVMPLMIAGILGLQMLEKGWNSRLAMLTALPFGVMIGFKAWGGTLVLAALVAVACWMSLRKIHAYWLLVMGTLGLDLLIFLPIYDPATAAGLVFVPGWLLKRMVEDPDRYNMVKFYFLEQHYREKRNWLRLVQINGTEVLLYVFGNLWLRALGFVTLIKRLKENVSPTYLFMTVVILGSLFLPLLFNQGRMSYDIIQYGPYGLLLMGILTAPVIVSFVDRLPKPSRLVVLVIVMSLFVPSNSRSVIERSRNAQILVTNGELEAYAYLKDATPSDSRILLYPSKQNTSTAVAAALTHRQTYFSAETFVRITGDDYEGRKKELIQFFQHPDPGRRQGLIREMGIDYLVLTPDEEKSFNPAGLSLNSIFSNDSLLIYELQ